MTGEGELQQAPVCHELIQQAPQSPEVASEGVLLVLPQLWRHVVRCANLCVGHSFPDHLRNTQITHLHLHLCLVLAKRHCRVASKKAQKPSSKATVDVLV